VVVEELIAEDHPARAIWDFVGRLDLTGYTAQVKAVDGRAGRPPHDPHLLVSVWVYSYSRGVSSARAIAQLCEYHPALSVAHRDGGDQRAYPVGLSRRS